MSDKDKKSLPPVNQQPDTSKTKGRSLNENSQNEIRKADEKPLWRNLKDSSESNK